MTSLCALVVGCPPESRKKIELLLEPYGFECVMLERAAEALEYSHDIVALLVICMEVEQAAGHELESMVREGYFGASPPPVIRVPASGEA
jgi:CheY-like chemotaxis protein